MTDWWKVSFSSLHANLGMGVRPRGKCKNQSTRTLTFLPLFSPWMADFIFVITECQLGIPYFSKHRNQAMSTQENASLPLWLASYRSVCKSHLLRLLNRGWKRFKIGWFGALVFLCWGLEPRAQTPWASPLPQGYTLDLFGDLFKGFNTREKKWKLFNTTSFGPTGKLSEQVWL